ncbi:hypothetical protein ABPG72_007439 [Tetrahymena utriculariae]
MMSLSTQAALNWEYFYHIIQLNLNAFLDKQDLQNSVYDLLICCSSILSGTRCSSQQQDQLLEYLTAFEKSAFPKNFFDGANLFLSNSNIFIQLFLFFFIYNLFIYSFNFYHASSLLWSSQKQKSKQTNKKISNHTNKQTNKLTKKKIKRMTQLKIFLSSEILMYVSKQVLNLSKAKGVSDIII